MIEILAPGPLSVVQDLGRPGLASLGVGPSGAADVASLRLGNRLVGNGEDAAGVEVTFGGLAVRCLAPATVALTGAPCDANVDGRAVHMNSPVHIGAGATLRFGTPTSGLRSYLAVRGGIDVPLVLGSRSTDVLAGIGPPALAAGQRLPIGPPPPRWPLVDHAPTASLPAQPVLHLLPGPRLEWFDDTALDTLAAAPYEVSAQSNRTALRLLGEPVRRAVLDELPSEGLVVGAIQIPPDGRPVLFLADHPVTGGYPVVAVVRDCEVPLAAQLRPGQSVRFSVAVKSRRPDL
ncbi:MAG: biotin-dependent carboxyltransferase family protein [Solirubrobacteraceae bacterium]